MHSQQMAPGPIQGYRVQYGYMGLSGQYLLGFKGRHNLEESSDDERDLIARKLSVIMSQKLLTNQEQDEK